jgi:hypothetical protein
MSPRDDAEAALDVAQMVFRIVQGVLEQTANVAPCSAHGEAPGPRTEAGVVGELREPMCCGVQCVADVGRVGVVVGSRRVVDDAVTDGRKGRLVTGESLFHAVRVQGSDVPAVSGVLDRRPRVGGRSDAEMRARGSQLSSPPFAEAAERFEQLGVGVGGTVESACVALFMDRWHEPSLPQRPAASVSPCPHVIGWRCRQRK